MAELSANFVDSLTGQLTGIFVDNSTANEFDFIQAIYGGVSPSDKYQEYWEQLSVGGEIPEYTGGDLSDYERALVYGKTFIHKQYAKSMKVESTLVEDERFAEINNRAAAFAEMFGLTRQIHAINLFDNAFDSSATFGDGVALCSSSHPLKTGTQSNYSTSALSVAAVSAGRQAMMKFKNYDGISAMSVPDILLVHPDKMDLAIEICESEKKSGTANHDINVNNMPGYKLSPLVCPLLSNNYAWFMIDSRRARRAFKFFERIAPTFFVKEFVEQLYVTYGGKMRHIVGCIDHKAVYGSNASS